MEIDKRLQNKLKQCHEEYQALSLKVSAPGFAKDSSYKEQMKEFSRLGTLEGIFEHLTKVINEALEAEELAETEADEEIRAMARDDLESLLEELESVQVQAKSLLVPVDPLDEKNIILEIRAGTGGDEAAFFAADLFRMYSRYAERQGWKLEVMSTSENELGGYKEIVASVSGKAVYRELRWESGVHRVQRIPSTETQGRIHTSASTVAVLPEAEETEIEINPKDLRIDTYRAQGAGGQHVNMTDSAVRITHIPTGVVATCQDERSQFKNKDKAMAILRARLYEREVSQKAEKLSSTRKLQVGSGDRSHRIRTYNFPQNRVTDHRIGLTIYKLADVMDGDLDLLFDPLKISFYEQQFEEEST